MALSSKDAQRAYNKAYREKHKERLAAQKKAYISANRQKHLEYHRAKYRANRERYREQSKAYRQANLDRIKDGERLRKYGLTAEQYTELLRKQNERCAICGAKDAGGRGSWHVDHCHSSGKIRDLLCHTCNVALGNFKDDPRLLVRAVSYLTGVG